MNNPCSNCNLSCKYKHKHLPRYIEECNTCSKRRLYEEYLKSQRKFIVGEKITNIQDLLNEEWIIWHNRTKHIEVFKSMPLRVVIHYVNNGAFNKAVLKESSINKK